MTTWLWIVGVAALVWPIVVALRLDAIFTKHINLVAERSENGHLAGLRAQGLREEILKLQTMVEQQDALIALLWHKAFGQVEPESARSGTADLVPYFGQRPGWYANAMEYPGAFDTLSRYDDFPWSKPAECLRR